MKKEDEKIGYKEGGNIFRSEVLCGLYQPPSFGTIAGLRNTTVAMLSLLTRWRAHRTFLGTSEQLPAEPVFQTKRSSFFKISISISLSLSVPLSRPSVETDKKTANYNTAWNKFYFKGLKSNEGWQFTSCVIFKNANLQLHLNADASAKHIAAITIISLTKVLLWQVPGKLNKWYDIGHTE